MFDRAAFIRAVNDAFAAQAPKNLDDADKFAKSGKAERVKGAELGDAQMLVVPPTGCRQPRHRHRRAP